MGGRGCVESPPGWGAGKSLCGRGGDVDELVAWRIAEGGWSSGETATRDLQINIKVGRR